MDSPPWINPQQEKRKTAFRAREARAERHEAEAARQARRSFGMLRETEGIEGRYPGEFGVVMEGMPDPYAYTELADPQTLAHEHADLLATVDPEPWALQPRNAKGQFMPYQ